LAHVLAKHAHYNPVEINASDDRTKATFLPQLQKAIEMRSVFGDCKPNLLIIDEIDGLSHTEGQVNPLYLFTFLLC
jgi:chromosome transmission fidelity protein 18